MSSSVANAQHLQKMDLHLGESDINFLQSILLCLTSSQSLQELAVRCDASGVFSGVQHTLVSVCSTDSVQYKHMCIHSHAYTSVGKVWCSVLFDWCGAMHSVSCVRCTAIGVFRVCNTDSVQYVHMCAHTHGNVWYLFDWCVCGAKFLLFHPVSLGFFH